VERDVKVPKLEQSTTPPPTTAVVASVYGPLHLPPPQPIQLHVPVMTNGNVSRPLPQVVE